MASHEIKITSLKPKVPKNQLDLYHRSEPLIAKLSSVIDGPYTKAAHDILCTCGTLASAPVEFVRLPGRKTGKIDGIAKCGNPVCPYCGSEQLTQIHSALRTRRSQLELSEELNDCTTYAGAFTCQHNHGDDIRGLIQLLRMAEVACRQDPALRPFIRGWVCSTEITTAGRRGNGAHPHTQFLYTLEGTEDQAHAEFWDRVEANFITVFAEHSCEIMGSVRRVSWQPGWRSPEGVGLTRFYGIDRKKNWDLLREATHGNLKNGGIWQALTPDECAEFIVSLPGNRLTSVGGCWVPQNPPTPDQSIIATLQPEHWNRLLPATQRMLKTIVMTPGKWGDEALEAYAEIASQTLPAQEINDQIQQRFRQDTERTVISLRRLQPDLNVAC